MDLSHLMTTNDAPHPEELPHIQRELDSLSKPIADETEAIRKYEARNGPLRSLVSALQRVPKKIVSHETQLRALEERQTALLSLLSPLRRVPPEILWNVFEALLEVTSPRERIVELGKVNVVSRSWRDAALGAPTLWSRLEVPPLARPENVEEALRLLKRAGTHPKSLSLTLCDHTASHVACFRPFRWIALTLVKTDVPLTHLSMAFSSTDCFNSFMSDVAMYRQDHDGLQTWENIESLQLLFKHKFDVFTDRAIRSLPPVKSLELLLPTYQGLTIRVGTGPEIAGIPPPFLHRLTTLSLRTQWQPSLFHILQECSNLRVLSLDILLAEMIHSDQYVRSRSNTEMIRYPPVPLPNLQTLRLRRFCESALLLLRALDTPRLSELDMNLQRDNTMHDRTQPEYLCGGLDASYVNALTRYVNLRRLRLHKVSFEYDRQWCISKILSALPRLTHLTLDSVDYHRWFFSNESTAGARVGMSDLEELQILQTDYDCIVRATDVLPELMQDLRLRKSRLRLVKMTGSNPTKASMAPELESPGWSLLRRHGVEVHVGFTDIYTE